MKKDEFFVGLKNFDFINLFVRMGWDNDRGEVSVLVNNELFKIKKIAEKRGFKILLCPSNGNIPNLDVRRLVSREIKKLFHENIIIFLNNKKTDQIWQYSIKNKATPFEIRYNINQKPELLYQKINGIKFALEEEKGLTLLDVIGRVSKNMVQNSEKVTKKFYTDFDSEHVFFTDSIEGIADKEVKKWYASIMLNRLMFCYFIQKKNFLDDNIHYLNEKLKDCMSMAGKSFHSFYKDFLLVLFHEKLGSPIRDSDTKKFGNVPYLNGGLFEVHQIEKQFSDIQIENKVFEKIFKFFDKYEWHLDTRYLSSGNEINPDVIGNIFEEYINDRASSGAYYTKEDVTGYVGKSSIIPWIFSSIGSECPSFISSESKIWQLLLRSPEAYIFDSVRHGFSVEDDVTDNVEDCRHQDESEASMKERRKRYQKLLNTINSGKIKTIDDFITYNLDLERFIIDAIETAEDVSVIEAAYGAILKISVLDPTCGSGAFLFAALNILEQIYVAVISKMYEFGADKSLLFKNVLDEIDTKHDSNLSYFIFKKIILNNLYGVDLMEEAVEVTKLRLFLKLVSVVDADKSKPNLGIEPLPDIDFNIRSGNTLVGFYSEKDLQTALAQKIGATDDLRRIEEKCESVAQAFSKYNDLQLTEHEYEKLPVLKKDLGKKLELLRDDLNAIYYRYTTSKGEINAEWLRDNSPFHWFAEFYNIMSRGGFDVIIGNPPYLSSKGIPYSLFSTKLQCPDIYGHVLKRSLQLSNKTSRFGFVVMHNLGFSKDFSNIRDELKKKCSRSWFSFYARIPDGLFSSTRARVRNCIFIASNSTCGSKTKQYTTRIYRWRSAYRPHLMDNISYAEYSSDTIPMFSDEILADFFTNSAGEEIGIFITKLHAQNRHVLYHAASAYNYLSVSPVPPSCTIDGIEVENLKLNAISFVNEEIKNIALLFACGRIGYSHWLTFGDEFDLKVGDIKSMKIPYHALNQADKNELLKISDEFSNKLDEAVQFKLNAGKKIGSYNTSKLWYVTDKSDKIFLKYLAKNWEEVNESIKTHVGVSIMSGSESNEEW